MCENFQSLDGLRSLQFILRGFSKVEKLSSETDCSAVSSLSLFLQFLPVSLLSRKMCGLNSSHSDQTAGCQNDA